MDLIKQCFDIDHGTSLLSFGTSPSSKNRTEIKMNECLRPMMSSARFIPANLDNCTGASVLETECSEKRPYALVSKALQWKS